MNIFVKYTKILIHTFFIINICIYNLYAQDEQNWVSPLKKCWEYKSDLLTTLGIASDNEKAIYITNINGSLVAIDTGNGKIIWKIEFGSKYTSKPVYFDKKILLSLSNDNDLDTQKTFYREIETKTGTTTLSIKMHLQDNVQILRDNKVSYILSDAGFIESIKYDGIILWKTDLGISITTSPILNSKEILFGTTNKTLVSIDRSNSNINNQINLRDIPSGIISQNNNTYFLGDIAGNIYSISKNSNLINWKTKTGGKITSTEITGKNLLVESDDNFAYSLSIKNGKKIWKRKLAGRVIGKVSMNKSMATYLSHGTNTAVLINLQTGEIVNKVILDEDLYFISPPIFVDQKIILPTQKGIYAFSYKCE